MLKFTKMKKNTSMTIYRDNNDDKVDANIHDLYYVYRDVEAATYIINTILVRTESISGTYEEISDLYEIQVKANVINDNDIRFVCFIYMNDEIEPSTIKFQSVKDNIRFDYINNVGVEVFNNLGLEFDPNTLNDLFSKEDFDYVNKIANTVRNTTDIGYDDVITDDENDVEACHIRITTVNKFHQSQFEKYVPLMKDMIDSTFDVTQEIGWGLYSEFDIKTTINIKISRYINHTVIDIKFISEEIDSMWESDLIEFKNEDIEKLSLDEMKEVFKKRLFISSAEMFGAYDYPIGKEFQKVLLEEIQEM